MNVAVCDTKFGIKQLRNWIEQYCALYDMPISIQGFATYRQLEDWTSALDIAFVGFGGDTGFLAARGLHDRDRNCKIILIDDTEGYAVRSLRIHCIDFILRPVSFQRITRSMQLATGRRGAV